MMMLPNSLLSWNARCIHLDSHRLEQVRPRNERLQWQTQPLLRGVFMLPVSECMAEDPPLIYRDVMIVYFTLFCFCLKVESIMGS